MIDLRVGDCVEKMKEIEENSVDFILCDPPYELNFMSKRWDNTGIAFNIEMWKEALRVLKPGGYLMAFSGTRTYHRMAVAIEDAGFEVKDMIEWVYGSGFPKALDISKAIDKKLGAEREVIGEYTIGGLSPDRENFGANDRSGGKGMGFRAGSINITRASSDIAKQYEGYKTQLKPAHEPICLAMKPLSEKNFAENVMKWGIGGLNIAGCRIGNENILINGGGKKWRKNGAEIEYVEAINETREGRFPANLILHEDVAPILDKQSGYSKSLNTIRRNNQSKHTGSENGAYCYGKFNDCDIRGYSDEGGASRFFKIIEEDKDYTGFIYHAKASKKDRNSNINKEVIEGNNHATVKPTGLIKYLLKMGLPPIKNAVVLDMFAGSGTTGVALEMLNKEENTEHTCILIEMLEEHAEIIKKRCCLD